MEALLENPLPEDQKKLRAFHKRMIKTKNIFLLFSTISKYLLIIMHRKEQSEM